MTLLKGLHLAPAASIPELISRVERLASGQPASAGASGGRSAPAPFRA
jgi:DNA polymerase III subunit gamma/tau